MSTSNQDFFNTACGCGSGGGSTSIVCGGECESGRALVRPHFFAGQLLTEEDLEALSTWMADKLRLHNRHLYGEGVACGLEVTCQPCQPGKIVVRPGYALDCCGNDIVVSRPEELDVNELVRRLRTDQLGGYDCGDPCAGDARENGDPGGHGKEGPRRYKLYVRYCENMTDLVAPYDTGEPCGGAGCEATRVREGHRFELRCADEDECPPDILRRLGECLGDLDRAERFSGKTQVYYRYSRNAEHALLAARGTPLHFDVGNQRKLLNKNHKLRQFLGEPFFLADREPGDRAVLSAEQLEDLFEAFQSITAALARFWLMDPPGQAENLSQLQSELFEAAGLVYQIAPALNGYVDSINLPQTCDRAYATALFAEAPLVAPLDLNDDGLPKTGNNGLPIIDWEANPVVEHRTRVAQLAYGTPYTTRFGSTLCRDLAELREWLLDRLDHSPRLSDCRLRREVCAVEIPQMPDYLLCTRASRQLTALALRYLFDCFCGLLHPPCPPCDDPAVCLAGLTVENCEVVKICNLERKFVLSPVALRYWVPPLGWIGKLFEWLCCVLPGNISQVLGQPVESPPVNFDFGWSFHSLDSPFQDMGDDRGVQDFLTMTGIETSTARSTVNFVGYMAELFQDADLGNRVIGPAMSAGAFFRGASPADHVRGVSAADLVRLLSEDEVRDAVDSVVGKRLEAVLADEANPVFEAVRREIEARVEPADAAVERLVKDPKSALNLSLKRRLDGVRKTRMKDFEEALASERGTRDEAIAKTLGDRLAAPSLSRTIRRTKVIRDLEKTIEKLQQENQKLAARLDQIAPREG